MKIVIFGAGYVGTVTGACLTRYGHEITFIEPNKTKVEILQKGKSPVFEPKLEELILAAFKKQLIKAKTDLDGELLDADIAMISVATPSGKSGALDLKYVRNVFETLTQRITKRKKKLIVAIRSTIHPLALRKLIKEYNFDKNPFVSIVANPEFLRESTAVDDFFSPPFYVAGGDDKNAVSTVLSLYENAKATVFSIDLETACLLKYACNAFHALKIAFANEIGSLCESLQVNSKNLMSIFCHDRVLNCSPAYLKPGFSFGGSCLPKDLRVLLSLGREVEEELPLLSSILPSNQKHFQKILSEILCNDHIVLTVIGLSFKAHNDDLRESPFVDVIETLLGKGIKVRIFDSDIQTKRILGSNLNTVINRLGHLFSHLYPNLETALEGCDGIILCKNQCPEQILAKFEARGIPVYDLQQSRKKENKDKNRTLQLADAQ